MILNLPTRSGSVSRAENDKFDDGLADEYAVKNGTLLLFEGADEANATFAGAYVLKNLSMNLVGTTTDNITTTTKIINEKTSGKFKRGEEKGYFKFGGSTIILLVNNVNIDEEIINNSNQNIETIVKMGEVIGTKIYKNKVK